ncbi:hypothetical protein [Vibrio cyclitrophicus]|uniref:hypothetical protein n=1 Tax=Vibrio cyclitrophicus TaxID=47951 RepID=UPI000C835B1F|nr:hypothetical protein [Vibrio cyclitrophicus]PMH75141.1 hypothetical protein BCU59_18080 [Vibrio cyclitrophicus]
MTNKNEDKTLKEAVQSVGDIKVSSVKESVRMLAYFLWKLSVFAFIGFCMIGGFELVTRDMLFDYDDKLDMENALLLCSLIIGFFIAIYELKSGKIGLWLQKIITN